MVETCLVAAPSCAAAAQVRSTVVHGQPIDLGAHLEIVRPLDDRQMVTELLVVGIVELPAIVDVVKAQVGIAVLVGVELASRTGHDVERSDTETGHAEAIVTGTGTSATPGKLLKAKPELVDHVLVERVDPLCGDVVGARLPEGGEIVVQGRSNVVDDRDGKPSKDAILVAEVVVNLREELINIQRPDYALATREIQRVRLTEVGTGHDRQDVVPNAGGRCGPPGGCYWGMDHP